MEPTLQAINNFIPNEFKVKAVNKAIEAIKYFTRASKLKLTFSTYLEKKYNQLSLMKTLLYKNEPVRLNECYVRNSVAFTDNDNHENVIEDKDLLNFILNKKRVVISGNAGLGKSVLCKSLFLEMVNNANGIYPIFIELRDLNNNSNFSLLEYICWELSDVENKIKATNLENLIKNGSVFLILDGFDGLDFDIRNKYSRQILDLSKKYKNINLLISSRPDETFRSWGQFYEVNINELDKKKSIELISKLRYDEKIKRQFIKKIDEELYETHKSFIGNPLLLTMMLMTFQEFAEIPNKIYLFYEQAFQTLFFKHDSLKDLYSRKSRTGMEIDEFKKVFSYFCISTHIRKEVSFQEMDAKKILRSALNRIGRNDVKAEDVLIDLMSNLCLLHKDGVYITFSHRSFQEYFTALYLETFSHSEKLYELIDKVVVSNKSNICAMLHEMNDELLETVWVLPKLNLILSDINYKSIDQEKEDKIIKIINGFFVFEPNNGDGKNFHILYVPTSTIYSYNHIDFSQDLWGFFHNNIRFNIDEVNYLLFPRFSANKEGILKDIISDLISYKEHEDRFIYIDFNFAKSKLDYLDYYKLINVFYKKIFSDKENLFNKIKTYIDSKQKNSKDDIEELLRI